MSCKIYLSEIEEAASGALLSSEAHAHLNACRKCLGVYEQRALIRSLVVKLEKIEAPPDFELRLRARLAASKPAKVRAPQRKWFVPSLASIALAACFVLTVASLVFFNRINDKLSTAQLVHAPETASPLVAIDTQQDATLISDIPTTNKPFVHVVKAANVKVNNTHKPPAVELSNAEGMHLNVARKSSISENVELSLRGANVITKEDSPLRSASANDASLIPIQVRSTSVEPLRMLWRDEQGNARRVSMRPVSFGAQNSDALSVQSSSPKRTDDEGVW